MYSENYDDDDEIEEFQNENFFVKFYRNNKVLVWILLGIILFIILMSLLTNGGSNSSKKASYEIKITPEEDVIISIGNSKRLEATLDGESNVTFNWSVTDSNIASVDDGTVRAINYGNTMVIASYKDNDGEVHKAYKNITVADGSKDIMLTGVDFKKGDLFMPIGSDYKISLILTPSNAFIDGLSFTSSNTGVVTVDNTGNVHAVSSGEATVSYNVNNGAYYGYLNVYVDSDYTFAEIVEMPQKISFDGVLRKIKIGDTSQLTYTVDPIDSSRSRMTWESSNPQVVTVDNDGFIRGISEGNAVITIRALNGVNDKIDIEVEKDIVEVTDISIEVSSLNMIVGETQEIFPTIAPDDASNKAMSFSSSDEIVAVVVPNNVGTSAKIYALNAGTSTIRVRSDNGIERSLEVIVEGTATDEEPLPTDDANSWTSDDWTTDYSGGYYGGYSSGSYSSGSSSYTSKVTPTPKPTSTPRPVTYTCNITYSSGVATASGSASNGSRVKRITINDIKSVENQTSYSFKPNASGTFRAKIEFADGGVKTCSKYITVSTPRPTSTPKPVTYTCNITYSNGVITASGSASNGSRVKRITINDTMKVENQTSYSFKPNASGTFRAKIEFADGGVKTCEKKVTVATPKPVTYTCSLNYNPSNNRVTITGTASNGATVRKSVINGIESTYVNPTASGRFGGIVYFSDGGSKTCNTITVTVPTPKPTSVPKKSLSSLSFSCSRGELIIKDGTTTLSWQAYCTREYKSSANYDRYYYTCTGTGNYTGTRTQSCNLAA